MRKEKDQKYIQIRVNINKKKLYFRIIFFMPFSFSWFYCLKINGTRENRIQKQKEIIRITEIIGYDKKR